jgi:hypothetical protein
MKCEAVEKIKSEKNQDLAYVLHTSASTGSQKEFAWGKVS